MQAPSPLPPPIDVQYAWMNPVKISPSLSLSGMLDGQTGQNDKRKAAVSGDLSAPPGMWENEKARLRDPRGAPKKREDLQSQYENHTGPVVTVMVCNIPCRITQQQLADVVDGMGFADKYDFLYLPTGGRSSTVGSSNLGYGFINFMDPNDCDPFMRSFTNYQFQGTSSTKVCTVRPAHIQGLENNILRFDRTAAKGRPRREGPFVRMQPKEDQPVSNMMEELNPFGMNEMSWLEPSYFDFLEETPDYIVGCA
jgi:hypothetical protein